MADEASPNRRIAPRESVRAGGVRLRGLGDEFKQFLLRGNVVDLAVAVVIGTAFAAVVDSLVANFITPIIAAIGGQPDFSEISFTINNSVFGIGLIINALLSFVIIAAVIFLFVVKPTNLLISRAMNAEPEDPAAKDCPFCLSEIPLAATRCAYCTSEVSPEPVPEL